MLPVGQHTLTTPIDSESLKHCILVKLTDSSAKFIQEYLKTKDALNKKPTITFNENRGEITFPTAKSDTIRKFQFSLSSIKGAKTDGTASFECVSYSDERLQTIGTMEQKLTIQANAEESFQMTKDRVSVIAEEEKKNATKELKPSSTNNRAVVHSRSKSTSAKQVTALRPSSATTTSSNLVSQSTSNLSKPSNRSNERPLRERVVHFLGLKPYNRSELLLKLSKDGINDKEKEALDSLLQTIGVLNSKSQQYELQNEVLLSELKDDWPYYSSAERQLAKRAISNAKSFKSLGSKQSAFVPFNSIQRESPAPPQITQSSTLLEDFGLSTNKVQDTNKSKKISPKLNNDTPFRPIGSTSSSSTSSSVSSSSSSSSSSFKTSPKITSSNQSNLRVASTTPPAQQAPLQQIINVSPPLKQQQPQQHQSSNRKQDTNDAQTKQNKHSKENLNKDENKINAELNIFFKKYPKITNDEQRSNYKKDFEALYDEYFELHHFIDSVNSIFVKYQQDIQNLSKNSKEYENMEEMIKKEYIEKQNDKVYCEKRDRYNELYSKLKFIETLIHNYDSECNKFND